MLHLHPAPLEPIGRSSLLQARAALRSGEGLYRVLSEGIDDYAVLALDADGRVASWNAQAERVAGYPEEEVLGHSFALFYPPEDRTGGAPAEALRVALETGRHEGDGWYVRKDGSRFWARVLITPLHDEAGAVLGFAMIARDRTEQKRREEREIALARAEAARTAAEAAETRLRGILESVADPFLVLDREWRIVHLNLPASSAVRVDRGGLLGRNLWEIVPEAVGTRFWHEYRRAREEGVAVRFEAFYEPAGVWIDTHACPLEDGLAIHLRDITERKRAEGALRTSEERFQLAARATEDVVWDLDHSSGRMWRSDSFARNFGYALDEYGTDVESWYRRIHPDDHARVTGSIADAHARQATHWTEEYRYRKADGTYAYVLDRACILYDASGAPRRTTGTMVDLTRHRRAEERQRFLADAGQVLAASMEHAERLEQIARLAVPDLADLCIVDLLDGERGVRRVAAKHADPGKAGLARELLHHPPGLDGRGGISRVLREESESVLVPEVGEVAAAQVAQDDAHLALIQEVRPSSYLVVPLRARGRTMGAITLVFSDSGRRYGPDDAALAEELARRAALALDNARLYAAAQQGSRAKSEFLGVMSHEFRTPLTAILGYTELLETGTAGPVSARQAEYLDCTRRAAHQLLHMVEEILTFSRTESGREPFQPATCGATDAARKALELIAPSALEKGLELQVDVPESELLLCTDPMKLHQILTNLLSNAVKYTSQGRIRVEVSADGADGVRFAVSDTGRGIEPELQERVFEPFWQAERSLTRSAGGVGLGLAVVSRLVQMLGGSIEVRSTPGAGSTFTVRLPSKPAP